MSFGSFAGHRDSFALRGRPRAIVLDDEGMHHPGALGGLDAAYTRYDELTHLASSPRTLWIGSRRSVYAFPRRGFDDPADPERLARALVERVARLPDGAEHLARMRRVDELARRPRSLRATWGTAAACVLAFACQLVWGPGFRDATYFSATLLNDGDLWRLLTANLVHGQLVPGAPGFPLHLLLNVVGLLVVGSLVERPLGSARTLWVMGASALGAMGASALAGYWAVVGVSGVVFGLAGALTWLELRGADVLPAPWRLPRRLLIVLLAVNGVLMLLPIIAGAAHVGGFAAGWLATAAVGRAALARRPPRAAVRAAAAALVALTALALATAVLRVSGAADFEAEHARRLAALPGISSVELNDRAWLTAIDERSTRAQLEAALRMAERAVAETGRSEPTLLDTLAEVHFQLGNAERALEVIDEAIAQDPRQPYYREQRRRFTGERAAEERPEFRPLEPEAPDASSGDPPQA